MNERVVSLVSEWKSYVNSENYNLIEKCLKLVQILEYPELDISKEIEKIKELGIRFRNRITESKNPTYIISLLNEFLFDVEGFQGDLEDYYNPKNNFLSYVLEKKSGIPITLCILYTEIAKYVNLDLRIVGFPSHVIVKYGEEMILDPFNRGRLLELEDLQEILYQNYGDSVEFEAGYLNQISNEKIIIRILRNLKNSYTDSFAYEMASISNKMILEIIPNSPDEILDMGILEERLQNYDSAIKFLNKYLEMEPNAEDVDFVLELIREIRDKINQ
ncbi:MAG: transglutaminase family protein [Candidatus Nitrosopelagicus sp.]|nr:transglutaminase family protein [Candidatus Nitrosopelagicus sp.]